MIRSIAIILLLLTLLSCSEFNQRDLHGKWVATEVSEEGRVLELNPAEITLDFGEEKYEFTSTISYKESGDYALKGNFILTKDTIQGNSKAKKVEVIKLSKDSLQIKMVDKSKNRILKMKRKTSS